MPHGIISNVVRAVVFLNGLYDLLCFAAIMWLHWLPGFSSFHLNVFRDEDDRRHPLVRRLLAYWILTYGVVRVLAGAVNHESYAMDSVAALTYFIEVFGFEYELCAESTVVRSKVTAITLMSLPIATALLVIRPLET
jgi:hypothetical protein